MEKKYQRIEDAQQEVAEPIGGVALVDDDVMTCERPETAEEALARAIPVDDFVNRCLRRLKSYG